MVFEINNFSLLSIVHPDEWKNCQKTCLSVSLLYTRIFVPQQLINKTIAAVEIRLC